MIIAVGLTYERLVLDSELSTCFQGNLSYFVTIFAKRVLYMHSVKSHFSPPFDRYNNRPTVCVHIIASSLTFSFYRVLFPKPV